MFLMQHFSFRAKASDGNGVITAVASERDSLSHGRNELTFKSDDQFASRLGASGEDR